MGAKVAMTLSCKHPDRVSSLISLDTAPISFANDDRAIKQTINHLNQIKSLDIHGKSRKGAIEVVEKEFTDKGIANFITTNLVYDEATNNKTVKWGVNFDAIINNFHHIKGFNDDGSLNPYQGPSLFINGSFTTQKMQEEGAFPKDDLVSLFKPMFPDCTAVILEGAGHFIHTDKPQQVCSLIKDFLI